MSYSTPEGFASRCTFANDSEPHQIRIVKVPGSDIAVSCTCRKGYEPIAEIRDDEEAWREWHLFHQEVIEEEK